MAGWALLFAVFAAGCGPGSPATPDGEPQSDAEPLPDATADAEPPCEYRFGRTYILTKQEVLPEGEATVDLTGDGVPDNAMAVLSPVVNLGWQQSMADGSTIYLWDFLDWTDPPTPTDLSIRMVFYKGIDADSPPNPSNNMSGEGRFYVLAEQFDLECEPTSDFDEARIVDRTVYGNSARWAFVAPGVGTVEWVGVETVWHFNEDFSLLESESEVGVWTICGLSNAIFPGPVPGTFLDLLVKDYGVQADIDWDKDGLEQVIYAGSGEIDHCIDGDGTIVQGRLCTCDPRIADGYSVAMRSTGVPATIVGVLAGGT